MGRSSDAANRITRIAVTVSVVSVVYVILELCNTIIRTQLAIGVIDGVHPPPEFFASMMACQTNHGINIVLYCLSGEQFREEFINLLRFLCCVNAEEKEKGSKTASSTDQTALSTQKIAEA